MKDSFVGEQIGHYRIDTMLGRGGMGAVYRAYDLNLARPVALKVMHGHLADQARFKQRFMQEAQAVARLDHPSIVNIHDFGQEGEILYMVMSFIQGGNLAAYIKELKKQGKSIKLDETLFLLAQVADALGYAHAQGVLHRDIKPDNIMIKQLLRPERAGEPSLRAVVTDFGLAKLLEGGMHTATGTLLGTMDYLSPEQCKGETPDNRSDIYALGIMIYQLATGQLPYQINSLTDAIIKHTRETPPAPGDIRPELPPQLGAVIEKAMTKEPDERYQRAEEIATAMRRIAASLTDEQLTFYAPITSVHSIVNQLKTGEASTRAGQTESPDPVDTIPQPVQTAKIKVILKPAQIHVSPGSQASAEVTLLNVGVAADSVTVHVKDLPPGWVIARQEVILLTPGSQKTLPLIFNPPLDNSATAGSHRFRLNVNSEKRQLEVATTSGHLLISAFERFASELQPNTVLNGGTTRLFVRNDGNIPITFRVGGEDPEKIIRFESLANHLQEIEPGQVGTMDLRILTDKRPFVGRSRAAPFALQVNAVSSHQQINGRLEIKPRLPVWLVGLFFLFLFAGAAVAALAVISSGLLQTAGNDGTSEAQLIAQQQTVEAQAVVLVGQTTEAQETAGAMQTVEAEGTVMAVTAEAAGDDDNDGLSNQVEAVIGTDPRSSDSDGDGLLDGEEVNQYNSDPTAGDTDGDGLTDGEEIRIYRTSVNNPDTDADGLSDGDEIAAGRNPLIQETSTPPPSATATRTPIPTRTPTATPTPTPTSTPQTTGAGTGGGLPLGFQSFGVWGRGDQDNGTITQSSEQAYSGGSSAKISYDFKTADNDFVVFLQFNDIAGQPTALQLWVYGDGTGHYLNAWIIDTEGQTWQVPFGRVTHTGWKLMTGLIDTDQDWPWTHISGPNNEIIDYPIRFRGFVLDDINNAFIGQGAIYLDDLTAVE